MGREKGLYKAAIGLSYDSAAQDAPTVEVKGEHAAADRIVRAARRFGVPVVENGDLARALRPLELGQAIPARLFNAVAIVLTRIERRLRSSS